MSTNDAVLHQNHDLLCERKPKDILSSEYTVCDSWYLFLHQKPLPSFSKRVCDVRNGNWRWRREFHETRKIPFVAKYHFWCLFGPAFVFANRDQNKGHNDMITWNPCIVKIFCNIKSYIWHKMLYQKKV